MDSTVALAKRRGFIFQSSEIYGGFNGFFDYGPLGSELKKNIRDCLPLLLGMSVLAPALRRSLTISS